MELYSTKTGENTLYLPKMDETYHSRDGAISEALHVFINEGFTRIKAANNFTIFEVGFGTGLNALVTAIQAEKSNKNVHYECVEAYPVPTELAMQLKYGHLLNDAALFQKIHETKWESKVQVSNFFSITKIENTIQNITLNQNHFDCIYFDAFAPKKQPEMWQKSVFQKLYDALKQDGILTTYSAAGQFKRDLKSIGFRLEHPPGANGKREMTVAVKDGGVKK